MHGSFVLFGIKSKRKKSEDGIRNTIANLDVFHWTVDETIKFCTEK